MYTYFGMKPLWSHVLVCLCHSCRVFSEMHRNITLIGGVQSLEMISPPQGLPKSLYLSVAVMVS